MDSKELKLDLDLDGSAAYAQLQSALRALSASPARRHPRLREWSALAAALRCHSERVGRSRHELSDANLSHMPDYEGRISVLQDLGYLDAERTVTLKGRVACEINTADELLATEVVFSGLLTDLEPAEAVALLSAFVCQEKNTTPPELTDTLAKARSATDTTDTIRPSPTPRPSPVRVSARRCARRPARSRCSSGARRRGAACPCPQRSSRRRRCARRSWRWSTSGCARAQSGWGG